VDGLIAVLQTDCRATLAARAAVALADIGRTDEKVRTALVNLWNLPLRDDKSRLQLAIALCRLHFDAPGLVPTLTGVLVAAKNAGLRKTAAEALGWRSTNEPDVVPALTAALHDDDEDVRKEADASLTRLGLTQDKAVKLCGKRLKDSPHAETALRKSGAAAVPALVDALRADTPLEREKAARTLGALGEVAAAAAPALRRALADDEKVVRQAVAKALWAVAKDADAAVPVLVELLKNKRGTPPEGEDAKRQFVQTTIEALCRIGPPAKAALAPLNKLANDDNRLIRESAQRAVKVIEAAAVPAPAAR
jgi:HEAT repeat protein